MSRFYETLQEEFEKKEKNFRIQKNREKDLADTICDKLDEFAKTNLKDFFSSELVEYKKIFPIQTVV